MTDQGPTEQRPRHLPLRTVDRHAPQLRDDHRRSFAESKERIGGFYIIEAEDLDAALG